MDKKMLKAMMNKDEDPMKMQKKEALMDVLRELMEMADSAETNGLMDGMQKVTVAAPDKEGLEMGLEKADEVLEEMPEDPMMDMDEDEEDEEEM